jgi:hypothetical protein
MTPESSKDDPVFTANRSLILIRVAHLGVLAEEIRGDIFVRVLP